MAKKIDENEKKKMGRPKKNISKVQFERLCEIQCTQEEICSVLGVCEDTLNAWCKENYTKTFSAVFKEKRAGGKSSLRRKQWNLADTNASMAIFLGKQYLDQRDDKYLDIKSNQNITYNIAELSTEDLLKLAGELDDELLGDENGEG